MMQFTEESLEVLAPRLIRAAGEIWERSAFPDHLPATNGVNLLYSREDGLAVHVAFDPWGAPVLGLPTDCYVIDFYRNGVCVEPDASTLRVDLQDAFREHRLAVC